jgi:hypothetical protein
MRFSMAAVTTGFAYKNCENRENLFLDTPKIKMQGNEICLKGHARGLQVVGIVQSQAVSEGQTHK